jgi:CheY-like chemotaxis protein
LTTSCRQGGIELLRHVVAATRDSTVLMITACGDVSTAVLAMKAGAFHFVQKPFDAAAQLATVEEASSRPEETRDDPREIKEFRAKQAFRMQREQEILALLLERRLSRQPFGATSAGAASRLCELDHSEERPRKATRPRGGWGWRGRWQRRPAVLVFSQRMFIWRMSVTSCVVEPISYWGANNGLQ